MADLLIEYTLKAEGYNLVAGVDEAGRGPLAGPVCAAAVILPDDFQAEGVNDSKKLTEKKRETLYDYIIENALAYAIEFADHKEIDEYNIRNATFRAMSRAVANLQVKADYVIIDGNAINYIDTPHSCVIKGDSKSLSIAAASILAKVTRDRFMDKLDKEYPMYGFKKHKGYPTKLHYEALKEHGPCPYHRMTFNLKLD
ncbi:MAG: ribonuclease HII [Eubacteriales bacterium]|nr:ribonuclease HII [Eubacteriales bacterium]